MERVGFMELRGRTDTGVTIVHPKRALLIRGVYEVVGGVEEAVDIEQVEFFSVYAYEGNRPEGPAWLLDDVESMDEAISYARGFLRGLGE